jgi:hypothetical protein
VASDSVSTVSLLSVETGFSSLVQAEILESAYVGDAGSLSENLQDLQVILRSGNNAELLQRLYEQGTLVAKLYAIIGFQLLDERDLSLDLIKKAGAYSSESINVMEGCILHERHVGDLLGVIAEGYYRDMFASAFLRS